MGRQYRVCGGVHTGGGANGGEERACARHPGLSGSARQWEVECVRRDERTGEWAEYERVHPSVLAVAGRACELGGGTVQRAVLDEATVCVSGAVGLRTAGVGRSSGVGR